jgi:hypothetical protein
MSRLLSTATFFAFVQAATVTGRAAEPDTTTGIAAKYPGDRGIAKDPRVLFAEDFEEGAVADIGKRWGEASNKDGKVLELSSDVPPRSRGKRSLRMTATLGENTGGHLYTRLPRGVDRAHARFHVKFEPDPGYIHHFVHLGGYNPPTPYPQGGAGTHPAGGDRITVGIEPWGYNGREPPPGAWNLYAYWHEMKGSADGKYWGNGLRPARPAVAPRNRWQSVEIMVQLNSEPEKTDGEAAIWIDGKPVARFAKGARRGPWSGMGFHLVEDGGEPFEGFRWRSSKDLQLNFFWLLHYVTENAARQNRVKDPKRTNAVWFDDIVVATEYIGPVAD